MGECEVILNVQGCQQGHARATCYACGKRVCTVCSKIMKRYGRRVRVCNDCQEDDNK